jgi:pimeloyl-ACP methyl ester carboxylesterase
LPGHSGVDRWYEPTFRPGVEKILDEVKLNDTIAIGWSLGGNLLLSLALQKPEKLKAIVLVGSTPSFITRSDFPYGQSKNLVRRMRMELTVDFHGTLERFYLANFSEPEKGNVAFEQYREVFRKSGESIKKDDVITALDALIGEEIINDIPSIDLPVLLIHGSSDMVCPVNASTYLMKQLPRGELKIIEGAGHAPFLTRSEEFNMMIRSFIEKRMNETD